MSTSSTERALSALLVNHEATHHFGQSLGSVCRTGDVLALCGPLAAGKTTLSQGLARGLGVPTEQRVSSPTFAICNEYVGRQSVLHIDLYRMNDPEEAEALGFRERVGSEGIAIIEWADRFPGILPLNSLWLRLDHEGEQRRLEVWLGHEEPSVSHWAGRLPAPGPDLEWNETTAVPPWERPCSW